jgi:uncharacterized repeat protein (TIGR03803 family)
MKPLALPSLLICSLAIASCARAGLPAMPPGLADQTLSVEKLNAAGYRVISLDGANGANPYASLIHVHGSLYGTTESGGANSRGTVFTVSATGVESAVYSFYTNSSTDGYNPYAGLIDVHGTLYGTTEAGGKYGSGSVFRITGTDTESVVFSFNTTDGSSPYANLIDVNGALYGTTKDGGAHGYGTVFGVSTTGTEQVLHSFKGDKDGAYPVSSLSYVKSTGTLYGTTSTGGFYDGTVFSVTTAGKERVLYRFRGASHNDGNGPYSGLIDVKGTLYGTTIGGGTEDAGTVYSIGTTGVEHVLHSFGVGKDGAGPYANLIDVKGTLYGTTKSGGTKGMGTVFSVSTTGVEHVLHSFAGGKDGANPTASLVNVKGTLYGTTVNGGSKGDGTIFALSP